MRCFTPERNQAVCVWSKSVSPRKKNAGKRRKRRGTGSKEGSGHCKSFPWVFAVGFPWAIASRRMQGGRMEFWWYKHPEISAPPKINMASNGKSAFEDAFSYWTRGFSSQPMLVFGNIIELNVISRKLLNLKFRVHCTKVSPGAEHVFFGISKTKIPGSMAMAYNRGSKSSSCLRHVVSRGGCQGYGVTDVCEKSALSLVYTI